MKIGILTFHCAHNYGAVLQCFALQEFLKGLGHDVEVIDYRPSFLIDPYKIKLISFSGNIKSILKNIVVQILTFTRKTRRFKAFARFIDGRLNLSSRCDETSVISDMDAYIFGSDQIWNSKITKGGDNIYWGILPFDKKGKKFITYAASMGIETASENEKKRIEENLKNFDAISVRESSLRAFLAPLTDKEINWVLDPTLLASRLVWDKLDDNVKDRGYVLVYQVRENTNTMEFAKHIAHQLNANVISVEAWVRSKIERGKKSCASPEDFVSYVKHASCVVTTSFHGTAFSVIFNRPFYCLELGDSEDGRSKSLLHSLHLEERMVDKYARPSFSNIDYTEANEILKEQRKSSKQFLIQNL